SNQLHVERLRERPLLDVDVAVHFLVLHDLRNTVQVVGHPSVRVVVDDTRVEPSDSKDATERRVEAKMQFTRNEVRRMHRIRQVMQFTEGNVVAGYLLVQLRD